MSTARTLARAGLIVSGFFLVSRLLGFVRAVVVLNTFHPGAELDAFFAAFRLPDLMFQLVAAGALSSALIPVLSGLLGRGRQDAAWRVATSVTNLMLIGLAVIALIVFLIAPWLIPIITPGFDEAGWARTIDLTRIMLLSPIFLAIGSVTGSILNARGRFAASAIAPIVYNLAIIGGAVFLAPTMGVTGLAVAVVAGSVLHLLVQVPAVWNVGYRHSATIDLSDPSTRTALALVGPRALGLGVTQITFVVLTSLATLVGVGAVTAFNTAFTLLQIPIGVIGVPLGIVVLPSLSREAALGNRVEFAALVSRAIRLLTFVMIPITGIAIVLRRETVEVLFGFGGFDAAAIELSAATLLGFLPGLLAHALIAVLARAFYAQQDTWTPVGAAILAVAINTTLGVLLVGPLGLPGLAVAIAVAAWIEAGVLFVVLHRRVPELDIAPIIELGLRTIVISVIACAAAAAVSIGFASTFGAESSRLGLVVRLAVSSAVWLAVLVAAALALRIGELRSIVGVMVDALRRPRPS